jgi:hypothetical protein
MLRSGTVFSTLHGVLRISLAFFQDGRCQDLPYLLIANTRFPTAWPSWPAAYYRQASLWRELEAFLEFEILQ